MVVQSLTRPYPVSISLLVLFSVVPFYLVIANQAAGRVVYAPELALDRLVPLQPAWALVYGSLYFFLIALPFFVVRERDHIRRTVLAYLTVWLTAYACFLLYPTVSPRPADVKGTGFVVWALQFLYSADPPYNCFPSIHVAHSFVSALTCYVVHRRVGVAALICACLVGLSTLFVKQHYVLDVLAGACLAGVAWTVFLRSYPRDAVDAGDRHLAPTFAVGLLGVAGLICAGFWAAYRLGVTGN
jgi:membrane-associated phospholipid phosphatase